MEFLTQVFFINTKGHTSNEARMLSTKLILLRVRLLMTTFDVGEVFSVMRCT